MVLQDYVQAERQLVPKFVELCVKFLESEGENLQIQSRDCVRVIVDIVLCLISSVGQTFVDRTTL